MKPKLFLAVLTSLTLVGGSNSARAATRTWSGLGGDPLWSNIGNWSGGIRPAAADDVVFPTGAAQVATVNNWIGALRSITFQGGGYSISGNSLVLTNGINATNTSGVNVVAGTVILGANQSFTTLNAGAELVLVALDVHGHSATFGGAGTNIIANVIFDSAGSGSLANSGTGVFLLAGTNSSFTGPTVLNGGINIINSFHQRSPITWTAGTLGGKGVLGQVTASGTSAKQLTPGFGGTGILTTSNLVLNSSVTNLIRINGLNPGTNYDQIVVSNGNLTLGSATLSLSFLTNLAPSFGDTITLINLVNPTNTISGTFAGLPEGSTFSNNSSIYRLSYAGGDGNDVTLTVAGFSTGDTKKWTGGGTNSLWMNRSNWSGNVAPVQGDALTFPQIGVLRTTNVNDFPAETTFDSLFFFAPAREVLKDNISGNAIRLNNGVKVAPPSPDSLDASGTVVISNRLSLNFSQTFTNVVDVDVHFAGGIDLGLNKLSVGVRAGLPDIFFDGSIAGAGQFETVGDGTVTLNASNAITGNIFVNRGILVAQHAQALGRVTTGPVQVGANGTLRLQASNAGFSGSSIVLTGRLEAVSPGSVFSPQIFVAGSNAVITNFSGLTLQGGISNGSQLTLSGSGISRLGPKGFIQGSGLLKNSGHLQADASIQNTVQLGIGPLSGTLSGTGNVNTVVCTNTTGIIAPGSPTDATNAVGALTIRSLILSSGATLQMDLLRNKFSDLIITSNAPTLGNATLTLKALTNLAPAQQFILIRNTSAAPVTNTFANLPEGAFLGAANGNFGLQISYIGGDGNDVVVTVLSNTPPVMTLVNQFVNEQNLLTFANSAVDFDQPPQTLTWALLSAPAGVSVNPSNGVVTWTPTEAQGPSTNPIVLKVTDSGIPPLSSTGTVTVTVGEVNRSPVPVPVPLTNVFLGSTLTLQLAATDPDIPANALTWGPAPPATGFADATLSTNGLFTFTPTTNFPGTRIFSVSVRDFNPDASSLKSLTNTLTFSVRIDLLRVVTNTNDSGPGSLRQAILDINSTAGSNPGGGRIEFNIPGIGPFKIFLITALPPLLRDTVIDGYTQTNSHPNTLINGNDAIPLIELSGENIATPTNGLSWSGPRVTVRGLVINRWDTAIAAGRAGASGLTSNAVVEGCFIGTDPTGTQRRTNRLGISLLGATGARIGGPAPAQRNLISSSSQAGISLLPDTSTSLLHNLIIQNNFIGTDRAGTNALGNGTFGLLSQTTILSTNSLVADNVICANGQAGLQLAGARNSVVRNKIGLGVDGAAALGNGGSGIEIFGNQNLVGGGNGTDANLIANNNGPGVHVSSGTNHAVLGNSIFRNSGLGIDLGNLGPQANDLGDLDGGPNNLQNTPVLATNIVADSTVVTVNVSLASAVLTRYRLEFFHSVDSAPSNQPQAKTFLGSMDVSTDGNGNTNFSVMVTLPSLNGFISATATDPAGNTSEISSPADVRSADFYGGSLPRLSILGGNNQTGFPNLFLAQPLVILVTDTNNVPLSNAPVTFTVVQGNATLATSFTESSFSSLPVRTTGDGHAQVFCHLGPGVGVMDLITAAAFSGTNSTSVTFLATSAQPQSEGVMLQGAADAPALGAMVDMAPIGVSPNRIEDGIILTRLDVVVDPSATVGQVNAALAAVGGGIVTMRPGSPFTTVAIPAPANIDALQNVAEMLGSAPGIAFAFVAQVQEKNLFPFMPVTDDAVRSIAHLAPTRFPAAWNANGALGACSTAKLPVIVSDEFLGDLSFLRFGLNFDSQIPFYHLSDPPTDPNSMEQHGYLVTCVLGGLFDNEVPTGANPFSECLQFHLVNADGVSLSQETERFAREMSTITGKFIVNRSRGFRSACRGVCSAAVIGRIPHPITRAVYAAEWMLYTSSRWQDFFHVNAGGNSAVEEAALLYPGLGEARGTSEGGLASLGPELFTFIQDHSLWDPPPGRPDLPSLVPQSDPLANLQRLFTGLGLDTLGPADNVLIAGSIGSPQFELSLLDQHESLFSNHHPDVKAVGEHVTISCITSVPDAQENCDAKSGTSFSSPQVAGLASYLWLLSPELKGKPASATAQAIKANTRANQFTTGIVDAYATVLSLDKGDVLPTASSAPIRAAILDVNGDGRFDERDLQSYLSQYFPSGVPRDPTKRDFSRWDLNGDGFTGGSRTERFDLDRIGSTQFGQTVYDSSVPQQIEGTTITFDENALTDREILCYYAYSALYTGDTNIRSQLLTDICLAVSVEMTPLSAVLSPGESLQFSARVLGITNQAVTWSVSPSSGGEITTNGLFTAACTPTNGTSQLFTVRATSVAAPAKFVEVPVVVRLPIVVLSTLLTAGTNQRFFEAAGPGATCQTVSSPSTSNCGGGLFNCLDDGTNAAVFPDGPNFVCSDWPCACEAGSINSPIDLSFEVTASSQMLAEAQDKICFIAPRDVTVAVMANHNWGTGSTRVSATLSGAFNGQAVYQLSDGQVTQDSALPTFSLPKGAVLTLLLDAKCTGNSAGTGNAVTVKFSPLAAGVFELSPTVASVSALEPLGYSFQWTVPQPFNWHHLKDLQFRIRDGNNLIIWLRFNEADRTFSLYNQAAGRFGVAATAGSNQRLQTAFATLYLAQTSAVAAGPTSPTVTLNLGLSFKPSAAGQTYIVEVAASDDDGNADGFIQAGVLTIAP